MSDLIRRDDAIDAVDSEIVSTNPEHFKSSEKFVKFMDDPDIASFGKWMSANGFNTAVVAATIQLKKLPPAEPEIIRCKDCKYHRPSGKCKFFSCDFRNYVRHTDDEDFCSNAERRTDE